MLDIDGFFKTHGSNVLRFEIKIGNQVTKLEFSRDFVLGADRTNPFALQERNDEASSKAAMYGTLYIAAKAAHKAKQREFKSWYAGVHQAMKATMWAAINGNTALAYNMKKAPTGEDIENAIAISPQGKELQDWYVVLDGLERDMDQMKVLYDASDLDAQAARSMSSMGKDMLARDMIGQGAPRQNKPDEPKKPKTPDEEF